MEREKERKVVKREGASEDGAAACRREGLNVGGETL